jgi:hypothetical protein
MGEAKRRGTRAERVAQATRVPAAAPRAATALHGAPVGRPREDFRWPDGCESLETSAAASPDPVRELAAAARAIDTRRSSAQRRSMLIATLLGISAFR